MTIFSLNNKVIIEETGPKEKYGKFEEKKGNVPPNFETYQGRK
jgi:hypothetical protein